MAYIRCNDVEMELKVGKTVFDYADELAIQVPTSCHRNGICHECIVEVEKGLEALSPRTEAESFLTGEYRLACQANVVSEEVCVKFSPLRRTPKILSERDQRKIDPNPLVVRQGDSVLYDGEVVDRYRGHLYGIAIDLGTTTVVMDLVDLETGKGVRTSSFENPQRFGGSDVMHRITYDGECKGELQKAIVNAINHQIGELSDEMGFERQEIYEIVVAGNSTMRDLFFKLDVQGIGQRPYKSVVELEFSAGRRNHTALLEGCRGLGLRANPKAKVYGLPLIASHVGADAAADLIAAGIDGTGETAMLVDVGTNTEVIIGAEGGLLAASCPAGPAFEGGGIRYGMPGYEGAIESVWHENGSFGYRTIGNRDPEGICGSGLIDLIATLRRNDQMAPKGIFSDKRYELNIVPEFGITFSREDASNLAQAKAANYCGQYILMRHFGLGPQDIHRLYLAGGFANYVNVTNAIEIGFLAPVPEERISKIGNASVQGAREVLLDRSRRKSIETLVLGIEHVELETTPDFFEVFVEGCQFKPMFD